MSNLFKENWKKDFLLFMKCIFFIHLVSNVTWDICRLWWINLLPTSHPPSFHLLISDHCLPDRLTAHSHSEALAQPRSFPSPWTLLNDHRTISGGRFSTGKLLILFYFVATHVLKSREGFVFFFSFCNCIHTSYSSAHLVP